MHRFKWEWDSITTFNQFVASFVHPFRQKMSEVLNLKSLRDCPIVPLWEDRVKDDRHVLFEGFTYRPPSFIEFVQDPNCDREPLVRLGLLDSSQHRVQGIKQDTLTGSGDVAEQAAFDRIALRAIRRVVCHADRDCQVVDQALAVFLEPMRVTTVTATALAQQQDR